MSEIINQAVTYTGAGRRVTKTEQYFFQPYMNALVGYKFSYILHGELRFSRTTGKLKKQQNTRPFLESCRAASCCIFVTAPG
jgi:hypothetical protein